VSTGGQATGGVTGGSAGKSSAGGGAGGSTGGQSTAGGGAGGSTGGQSTAGAGGSSGGGSGGGSSIPPTFAMVKDLILGCFGALCHNEVEKEINFLNLQDNPPGSLHTKLTTTKSEACGPMFVVTPGKPEESSFLKILKGPCGTPPNETPRMPYGQCINDGDAGCVSADQMKAIEQWILNGAPAQ
jgi:hypothetical protein